MGAVYARGKEITMPRTITITGQGHVSLAPDTVSVELTLKATNKIYDKAMASSADMLAKLRGAFAGIGFAEDELKTVGFNVYTEHESIRDKDGNYKTVFAGYSCVHNLRLDFAFDTAMLSSVLSAVSGCVADPELNIRFTVKDKKSATDALLADAAADALRKAGILASASGVSLGKLLEISYSFGSADVYSRTSYRMEAKCMAAGNDGISIHPDSIELNDRATFTWEIV